jgi:hypothetical protein
MWSLNDFVKGAEEVGVTRDEDLQKAIEWAIEFARVHVEDLF